MNATPSDEGIVVHTKRQACRSMLYSELTDACNQRLGENVRVSSDGIETTSWSVMTEALEFMIEGASKRNECRMDELRREMQCANAKIRALKPLSASHFEEYDRACEAVEDITEEYERERVYLKTLLGRARERAVEETDTIESKPSVPKDFSCNTRQLDF